MFFFYVNKAYQVSTLIFKVFSELGDACYFFLGE